MTENIFILPFLDFYYFDMPMRSIFQKFRGLFVLCFFFNISAENVRLRIYYINKMGVEADQVEIGKKSQDKCIYHDTELNFQHRMHWHIKV